MSLQQKLERMKSINVSDDYKQALDDVIDILDQEEKCYCNAWGMPRIRPELKEFMLACEAELKRHDAIKGDSWKNMSLRELEGLFNEHYAEWLNTLEGDYLAEGYIDIANLAMMLWHRG